MTTRVPPTGLPVEGVVDAVRHALAGPGVAVLQAEPGAGKTTVVPLRLLDEPWLDGGRIVVLEPRRLAARAAARRMADLLREPVGETVGYRTRDERRIGPATRIEVVTEGILTRRLQTDPSLPGTALVVFDEVHERHLQTDLALAFALDVRAGLRPDLRLLAMSATLEAGRLARLLGGEDGPAPVVSSAGRTFPVEVRWRPPGPRDRPLDALAAVVREAVRDETGDVLVFLPGAAAIRQVAGRLGDLPAGVDVRPLHGSLPVDEQDRALAPSPPGRRRVVLSTDIAESSLTVDGVRVVVDGGQVRRPRYDGRAGMSRLHTAASSRASADQRAGRAGRLGPGVAYRVWSEGEHAGRRAFTPPEIAGADLTDLALELAIWGAGTHLAFLDPPPPTGLTQARSLLTRLDALDLAGRPTPTGRRMVELPLHPRLAHLVVTDRTRLACVLAALVEERDVLRGRPGEVEVGIDERVRLVTEAARTHPRLDGDARRTVRRRADELARRVGDVDDAADLDLIGPTLSLAFPDRVAQRRGPGRFVLRTGRAVAVASHDPLSDEPYLVVADLSPPGPDGPDDRIRLAARLDADDLREMFAGDISDEVLLAWTGSGRLEQRAEQRLGALILASSVGRPDPGPATVAALVTRVRERGLDLLGWSPAARRLRARSGFAHRFLGPSWPAVDDEALLDTLDEWLAPLLGRATGSEDLGKIDVLSVLRGRLGHRLHELDQVVPPTVTVASGRSVAVDYDTDPPSIAVRAQELYGTTVHPSVAGGRVPLTIEVLSPAGRPIQVTADLPGFWRGSWASVRRDMISAYPKHDWPADPATAEATTRARRGR
ncbi:MAG: ATP-dependent helicase HrpB [Acidimicrobiales bacterium]|nr:ATP-dependent helicase HrpB [Acidimicrobiales bacterium]